MAEWGCQCRRCQQQSWLRFRQGNEQPTAPNTQAAESFDSMESFDHSPSQSPASSAWMSASLNVRPAQKVRQHTQMLQKQKTLLITVCGLIGFVATITGSTGDKLFDDLLRFSVFCYIGFGAASGFWLFCFAVFAGDDHSSNPLKSRVRLQSFLWCVAVTTPLITLAMARSSIRDHALDDKDFRLFAFCATIAILLTVPLVIHAKRHTD